MATVASPYGLRPVRLLGGQPNSGSVNQYKIASGYGTGIFFGDIVSFTPGGTIIKFTGTTSASTPILGVFMGVAYHSATQGFLNRNQWTAGTTVPTGTDAMAYVCDDPDMLFEIQADEAVGQNGLGTNAALIQNAGVTATGMSKVALDGSSIADTASLPMRVVDFVRKPGSTVGDAYTDLLVKFNLHLHRSTTGMAKS